MLALVPGPRVVCLNDEGERLAIPMRVISVQRHEELVESVKILRRARKL
jgi:hypothetical protein